MHNEIVSELKRDYINKLLKDGRRVDGRGFDEYRPISVETGVISTAEGSARVRLGRTDIIAGVKVAPDEPYPDHPNMGVMKTVFEMGHIASPDFTGNPMDENAIEISRVTDRGIRESLCVDLDKLCIKPGERVWGVNIDIMILDYDGNLFDAAALASAAAVLGSKVPASRFGLGEDFPMPTGHVPAACTSAKVGGVILMDPGREEEAIAEARMTVVTDEKGDVRAIQKGGKGGFTPDEVKNIIKRSQDMGGKIREHLGV